MRNREAVDLSIYARGAAILVRNPVILVFPLLAALLEIGLQFLRGPVFDPVGGMDFGLFGLVGRLIDGFAFGLALIAAESAWRSAHVNAAAAWDEGKAKAGNILLATIGLSLLMYVASTIGGYLSLVGLLLPAIAFFFLIYTIPAAAIGGVPGGAALSASIERVRRNYVATAVLAVVSIVLYGYVVGLLAPYVSLARGGLAPFVLALVQAIVVAYLAVVTARQYDEVAFFRPL